MNWKVPLRVSLPMFEQIEWVIIDFVTFKYPGRNKPWQKAIVVILI